MIQKIRAALLAVAIALTGVVAIPAGTANAAGCAVQVSASFGGQYGQREYTRGFAFCIERYIGGNRYHWQWQGDGNFVLYRNGTPFWASNTNGRGTSLAFQGDGNVVIYQNGAPIWATGTSTSTNRERVVGINVVGSQAQGFVSLNPRQDIKLFRTALY